MPDTLNTPDSRSLEILVSIRSVFEQKGFDGASMQDLARAAEMSVGNFYRYFASKDAIIAAMVEHDLQDVAQMFGTTAAQVISEYRRRCEVNVEPTQAPVSVMQSWFIGSACSSSAGWSE